MGQRRLRRREGRVSELGVMTNSSEPAEDKLLNLVPDKMVSIRDMFGVDSDMQVPAFSVRDSHVPDLDEAYRFDPQTTLAICAGLAFDRRIVPRSVLRVRRRRGL